MESPWALMDPRFDGTNGHYFADIMLPSRRQESNLDKCRKKTLKCINSRPFLITICVLVVVECACVLAELMVDLQGIKFRFENEETEINRFVDHLRTRYPGAFSKDDMRSMSDVISVLEQSFIFRTKEDLLAQQSDCPCTCSCNSTTAASTVAPGLFQTSTAASSSLNSARERLPVVKFALTENITFTPPAVTEWSTPLSFNNVSEYAAPEITKDSSHSTSLLPSSARTTSFATTTNVHLNGSALAGFSVISSSVPNSTHDSVNASSSLPSSTPSSPSATAPVASTVHSFSSLDSSLGLSSTSTSERGRKKRNTFLINKHDGIAQWRILSQYLNNLELRTEPTSGNVLKSLSGNRGGRNSRLTLTDVDMGGGEDKLPHRAQENANLDEPSSRMPVGATSPLSGPGATPSKRDTVSADVLKVTSMTSPRGDTVSNDLWADAVTRSSTDPQVVSPAVPVGLVYLISDFGSRDDLASSPDSRTTLTADFHPRQKRQISGQVETTSVQPTAAPGSTPTTESPKIQSTTRPSTANGSTGNSTNTNPSRLETFSNSDSRIQNSTTVSVLNATNLTKDPVSLFQAVPKMDSASSSSTNGATMASATVGANTTARKPVTLEDLFVLEINNVIDSFFLVAEFVPNHVSSNETKNTQYSDEYSKVSKTSKALHFISLSILSVMVLETAIKLFCTGCAFFKKKFEVFDAFIVVSSFALDFVFLDSRWYETGKDATTILVLLLPWRVVRIVNSFLMTMKHKHHIQMMNMKRARKKAELKAAKLQTLLSEVRKDVQLLVALCRSNEIEEKDITACLYGKGRRSVTLSAMSTCTSLMLISTLGKDAVQEDDIYGKVFKEALNEGDSAEMNSEIQQAEDAAIDAAIELDEKIKARRKSKKYKSKKTRVKRSYTVPRRTASVDVPEPDINENDSNIFYINDSYLRAASQVASPSGSGDFSSLPAGLTGCNTVNEEDEHRFNHAGHGAGAQAARSKYQSTASVRSLPARKGSRSNSMVIYVPEFDEPIEIPMKTQRKRKSSVHFDSNV